MTHTEKHINQTQILISSISSKEESFKKLTNWILQQGYYPESYVLPPCFNVSNFELSENRIETKNYDEKWESKELAEISFPKTGLVQRTFGIIHPNIYHDIVWELINSWNDVLIHIFNPDNKIHSYSFPISIPKEDESRLRAGRMIYEFLEMSEKDLTVEAFNYKFLAKIDITNFYNSIYTHTISWAWIKDRIEALKDSSTYKELGTRIDKLFQYANDKRTNGIPVGPVVSDLIVEIILSERDTVISKKIKDLNIEFVATRFKDDYRFLCHSEENCRSIIKIVVEVLNDFNLQVNEKKTNIELLPDGLYRKHSLLYEPFSLRNKYDKIPFKAFETTYLKALQIHREYQGTSIIEKFLGELIDNDKVKKAYERLKIDFSNDKIPNEAPNYLKVKKQNIKKTISLLLLLKNESTKSLSKVLSIIECILLNPENSWLNEEEYILEILLKEIEKAIMNSSAFELIWLLYFAERHSYKIDISRIVKKLNKVGKIDKYESQLSIFKNPFVATIRNKMPSKGEWPNPFGDKSITVSMYTQPIELTDTYLIDYLDVFRRI